MMRKNEVKLDPPDYFNILQAVHVSHITPFGEQLNDISLQIQVKPSTVTTTQVDENVLKKVQSHRNRGREF